MKKIVMSASAVETEEAGAFLASELLKIHPDEKVFVCLYGDLGAGKTAFVRGFASVLSTGSRVKSPTYNIVNEYRRGAVPLYHFDLYRLCDGEDGLDSIGFDEYVQRGHCILEWSEYLPNVPDNASKVTITNTGNDTRTITMEY